MGVQRHDECAAVDEICPQPKIDRGVAAHHPSEEQAHPLARRLCVHGDDHADAVTIENDLGYAVFARVSRSCVKIQPKRLMTDEQRAVAAERLKKARDKQNDAI